MMLNDDEEEKQNRCMLLNHDTSDDRFTSHQNHCVCTQC